jgi:hypothetical protein
MATHDQAPLHATNHARLGQIAVESSTPPAWQAAWARLGPDATEEERLAVYQAVRAAGSVPDDAGFYLVSWQIDAITTEHAEEALQAYEDLLRAIERRHGLAEDECWPPGGSPPEYEEALRQQHDAWDALYAARLDQFGEREMARLFRTDRERFDQLSEAGRQFFHGPRPLRVFDSPADDPAWLDGLLEAVAGCVEADSPLGPLGLRYREEDGCWEVLIYPTPVELVGGPQDGAVVAPGFTLDLEQLRGLFARVAACGWNALGLDSPEGPYIDIEGVYQGRDVYLRVLAQAPDDEEPGLKFDLTRRPRRPE